MIGLDTDVIVRYVTQDDVKQAAAATRLFERVLSVENPGVITLVTLCEIAWGLADCCGAGKDRIRSVVEGLLASRQLHVEQSERVWKALRAWDKSSAECSDALAGELLAAQGARGS